MKATKEQGNMKEIDESIPFLLFLVWISTTLISNVGIRLYPKHSAAPINEP
jgi:hypothetical protein